MKDIVEQLRYEAKISAIYDLDVLLTQAADRIEFLRESLESAEEDVHFLDCLQAAGVDNWDGYDYARQAYMLACQANVKEDDE